jgi:hypothetical protein
MRILLSLLAVFALAASVAEAGPRFKVTAPLRGKDLTTGRTIIIPANHGFTFEIVDGGTLHPRMRVFDLGGLEVPADFPMKPSEEAKSAAKAELKDNIAEGLKATSEGAKVETDGCCDVMDNKQKEPEASEEDKAEAEPVAAPDEAKTVEIASPPEDFVDTSGAVVEKPAEKAVKEPVKKPAEKPVEKKAEVLKVDSVPHESAEVKKEPEKEFKIESPPEDFVDTSGKVDSPGEVEIPENVPVPEKKPEVVKGKGERVEEVEAKPADSGLDEAARRESEVEKQIAELKDVPVPTPNPRRDGRSPALEKPEAELLALPEENIPIPTPRPSRKDKELVAGGAKGGGHKSPAKDEAEKQDDKKADREPASTFLCRAYRAFRAQNVPEKPLKQAMTFLEKHESKFKGNRYFSIADYSQSSRRKRFYLLDLQNFKVTQEKVSHGAGRGSSADPDRDGMLDGCGDSGSKRTRAGFFEVGDYYFSSHGRYKWPMLTRKPPRNGMRLIGLSPGVNSSAFRDGYVMHEAKYNAGGNAIMGRSNGCPAFVPGHGAPIIAKLQGGSLHYNYAPVCSSQHRRVLQQVGGWESFCR